MSDWAAPSPSTAAPPGAPTSGEPARPGGAPHRAPIERGASRYLAALLLAAAVAAVVALASRSGGLPGAADPGKAATRELLPRVVLGLVGGVAVSVLATFVLHLRFAPRMRSGRRRRFSRTLAAVGPLLALAAGFGALAGGATSPLRQRGAITRDAGFTLTARPVDADGNGTVDDDGQGHTLIGLDLDGDGRIDRVLNPCPNGQNPTPAQVAAAARPGADRVQIAVDTNCDGRPERIVYLDPRPAPLAPDAARPDVPPASPAPIEVLNRQADRVRGVLAAVAVLAMALLGALVVAAVVLTLRGARLPKHSSRHPAALHVPLDAPIDRSRVAEAFGESIDAMLTDPDPRTGIIGAYAKLLDGLSAAGLSRRTEEAPLEHLRRCLDALHVPADPLERLTELFVLARFSTHAMHEGHRLDALDALRAALGHLADQPLVAAGRRR